MLLQMQPRHLGAVPGGGHMPVILLPEQRGDIHVQGLLRLRQLCMRTFRQRVIQDRENVIDSILFKKDLGYRRVDPILIFPLRLSAIARLDEQIVHTVDVVDITREHAKPA